MRKNILDEYQMTNKLMGEYLPVIEESVYDFMEDDEKKHFDSLPDRITLYRGCSIDEAYGSSEYIGQSWTDDIDIAKFFAYEHHTAALGGSKFDNAKILIADDGRIVPVAGRCVISRTFNKNEILGYVNSREEREYICDISYEKVIKETSQYYDEDELEDIETQDLFSDYGIEIEDTFKITDEFKKECIEKYSEFLATK